MRRKRLSQHGNVPSMEQVGVLLSFVHLGNDIQFAI